MKKLLLIMIVISSLLLIGLWNWHSKERETLEKQFIENQIETIIKPKKHQIEKIFVSIYQNLRTISLLPSVRNIQGGNRIDDNEDIIASGRFTEEGWETVQQIYNNLATNVSVSEIYAVAKGLDYKKGQFPIFMFDELVFGDHKIEDGDGTVDPDFPEESEEDEYKYFPITIAAIESTFPQFNYTHMDQIPAFSSPLMRTCDNTQYLSKTKGNVQESFGMIYSVPFYEMNSGNLAGVISAIIRANIFEAALMDIPFVPVTKQDFEEQRKGKWDLPSTSQFALSNKSYGINISDRRNLELNNNLAKGVIGRNVFSYKLNVHSDTDWMLSFFLPEAAIQEALAESDKSFAILVSVLLGVLALSTISVVLVARTRERLGGKPETVAQVVNAVSQGDLNIAIPNNVTPKSVLGSMGRMLRQLKASEEQSQENLRIRQALDNVSTCVMIVDDQNKIIYTNPALISLLHEKESEFKQISPEFSVTSMMGMNIENLHPNRQQFQKTLNDLTSTEIDNVVISESHFRLTLNPIFNNSKQLLGVVIVWLDRTTEVESEQNELAFKNQIAEIISAASTGDYSQRIVSDYQDGFYKVLADGMNSLLERISQALEEVGLVLGALAKGDLTQRVTKDYQGALGKLKEDSNSTIDNLTGIISQLNEAVANINTATREISVGNEDLSQRTQKQASSVEKTASSMDELSTTVEQNAENSNLANQMVVSASEVANKGGQIVQDVVATMSDIKASSTKVFEMIGVIDNIAFQTNVLALNASIEAARAQEHGRGFAVVAVEVRTLAQSCANAARDIKTTIESTAKQIEQGTILVSEAGKTMNDIVSSVKKVSELITEIAHATAEQNGGIELVKQAVHEIDETTQQNAALVEEATAASETLMNQAESLSKSVKTFRI